MILPPIYEHAWLYLRSPVVFVSLSCIAAILHVLFFVGSGKLSLLETETHGCPGILGAPLNFTILDKASCSFDLSPTTVYRSLNKVPGFSNAATQSLFHLGISNFMSFIYTKLLLPASPVSSIG